MSNNDNFISRSHHRTTKAVFSMYNVACDFIIIKYLRARKGIFNPECHNSFIIRKDNDTKGDFSIQNARNDVLIRNGH